MKKKIIIILLFQQLVMFSQTSDKYQNKINNNIFQNNQILNQDTLHYYWKNTYTLQMNTKSSLIKESFDELLEGVDSLNYLDSIMVVTNFGRAPKDIRITIPSIFPFRLTKYILSYFYKKNVEFNFEYVDYRPELFNFQEFTLYNFARSKIVYIGALRCPYSNNKRYISKPEVIQRLIESKNRAEFDEIARTLDEKKHEYERYLKSLESILRINCCEEIEDIELRIVTSKKQLDSWVQDNIVNKIDIENKVIEIKLIIGENGKVEGKKMITSDVTEEIKNQIFQILNDIPDFVPPKRNYSYYNEKKIWLVFE